MVTTPNWISRSVFPSRFWKARRLLEYHRCAGLACVVHHDVHLVFPEACIPVEKLAELGRDLLLLPGAEEITEVVEDVFLDALDPGDDLRGIPVGLAKPGDEVADGIEGDLVVEGADHLQSLRLDIADPPEPAAQVSVKCFPFPDDLGPGLLREGIEGFLGQGLTADDRDDDEAGRPHLYRESLPGSTLVHLPYDRRTLGVEAPEHLLPLRRIVLALECPGSALFASSINVAMSAFSRLPIPGGRRMASGSHGFVKLLT